MHVKYFYFVGPLNRSSIDQTRLKKNVDNLEPHLVCYFFIKGKATMGGIRYSV